ncbi:acetyl-CoA synthetase-like protein [Dichomitus squalens]|uniref:Acetyl-CoA synthetase-like protein n=1 Tax=Dichomitus squalens TaxID=114155 RepID=A0A4Q9P918_9APHY|nr:acetyl-CoA synthetase-like protein [Dichomitus squalens]TBU49301.1 acetyl-CoA synthetase-like protein [Dichomitus squalens]
MSVPLSFLGNLSDPAQGMSLGDQLAQEVTDSERITTLLDCLASTEAPVLWSTDSTRLPLSHAALRRFVCGFALPTSGFHGLLGPNDRVMVVLPTSPENAVALLAVSAYHTCAPVNSSCTAAEIAEDAARLRVKAVFTTTEATDRLELRKLREELKCEVIFMHAREDGPAGLFDMTIMKDGDDLDDLDVRQRRGSVVSQRRASVVSQRRASVVSHKRASVDVHQKRLSVYKPRPNGLSDFSLILHTSGTSGKKKVVPYTLRSLIVGTCAVIRSWNLRDDDVNMNMMPLFHVGGIIRNLWAPVFSGGSAIMCPGFDSTAFWPIAMACGATWYYAAPTMHHAILGSMPETVVPSRDVRIRMVANAAGGLLPTLAQQVKDTFGSIVLPSYGMTECMPIASPPTTYQLDRPGCSGIACGPHMSIRDPFNLEREMPRGSTGAVCVRGIPTFEGYETEPGAPLDTSAFSSEGWFDGGDVGYMDQDGYLFVTGRSKEIINKGGEVISPFEIEEAITSLASGRVKATIAFSIPHDVLQETIGVVIVPQPGAPRIGLGELIDLLQVQLHPSKWPFAIVYMPDLPKNAAGKPLRIKLAERLGIEEMSDETPAVVRHFETQTVPDKNAPLSTPIPCSLVSFDVSTVEDAIASFQGVREVAVRLQKDGTPEALVAINPASGLDSVSIVDALLKIVPGYSVPNPLYVFSELLARKQDKTVDWGVMEAEMARRNARGLSSQALVIRKIVAELLDKDPASISGDSDFFLLGGNSLLLGRLAHMIRKETGVTVRVPSIFTHSTISGIASLIEDENANQTRPDIEKIAINSSDDDDDAESVMDKPGHSTLDLPSLESQKPVSDSTRSQTHVLSLCVQATSLLFYPLKVAFTWTGIVMILSLSTVYIDGSYWERIGSLLAAIIGARLLSRIVLPIVGIAVKWIIIGRYKPGTYRFWSNYHLRWWITNQALRIFGRGIFSGHPYLEVLYLRLLGARVSWNVVIDSNATLGEYDLLTFHDGCRIDNALVRGFCIERDGFFRLEPIVIGRGAVVNTYTQIAPGATVPDGAVYGPHASSYDAPSPPSHAQYGRSAVPSPHWAPRIFFAYPVIIIVKIVSYAPWFAALYLLVSQPGPKGDLNSAERVIVWFSLPRRVAWHAFARIIRVILPPILQLVIGIIVKRIMGLNSEGRAADASQWVLTRRFINQHLLNQYAMKRAFDIIGSHYETTSIIWRCMGAKIGKRVYWPGSGVYCPDPELLEVGDDVVFGSRSEAFTTDAHGSGKIIVKSGAMIADRVVLLPGVSVGKRAIMGSGALAKRDMTYADGSVWMGSEGGEAVCFKSGSKEATDDESPTITPFGRAFYKREATYFVFPYPLLVSINTLIAIIGAGYWSIAAVVGTQVLNQLRIHLSRLDLFRSGPQQTFVIFGLIACWFILTLVLQAIVVILWVVVMKWIVIGRRAPGSYDWDKSSYCQRWQLHLVLAKPLYRGYGNGAVLGAISGSAYIVWFYRAMGAKIGKNVSVFAGGRTGLMTEPDLVDLGDNVALDNCSVVAHINSRGNFALNALKIGPGCALRSGSRLLSGASMEPCSMLLEHTLLTSGEIAEADGVYAGWPAQYMDEKEYLRSKARSMVLSMFHTDPSYRALQRTQDNLEDERRRLDKKLEHHQRELQLTRRRIELKLLHTSTMRNSKLM